VFTGQLDDKIHDLTVTAGEHVRTGDFSALTTPGRYRVKVGDLASAPLAWVRGCMSRWSATPPAPSS
jgi:endoglucanase